MIDKAFLIVLGWALCATAMACFMGWLLYKKQSTTNKIDNLKQKNKRNKQSSIDNDITATIPTEKLNKRNKNNKKGILKRIKEKRLTKKQNK